jgi:hypothetical protein
MKGFYAQGAQHSSVETVVPDNAAREYAILELIIFDCSCLDLHRKHDTSMTLARPRVERHTQVQLSIKAYEETRATIRRKNQTIA